MRIGDTIPDRPALSQAGLRTRRVNFAGRSQEELAGSPRSSTETVALVDQRAMERRLTGRERSPEVEFAARSCWEMRRVSMAGLVSQMAVLHQISRMVPTAAQQQRWRNARAEPVRLDTMCTIRQETI